MSRPVSAMHLSKQSCACSRDGKSAQLYRFRSQEQDEGCEGHMIGVGEGVGVMVGVLVGLVVGV